MGRSGWRVDRLDPYGLRALERLDVEVVDGGEIANLARVIKSAAEIAAMRAALAACERAIGAMEAALEPGMTEQELWAVMHRTAIAEGGGWFETRLLSSGPRTNPWFQECSDRVIRNGDLVAFDTDHIGVGGYGVDISRTWLAGDARPTGEQRTMYAAAYEQVQCNIEMLRARADVRRSLRACSSSPWRSAFPAGQRGRGSRAWREQRVPAHCQPRAVRH